MPISNLMFFGVIRVMLLDPIRSIIIPILLLAIIVAIGLFHYRESFIDLANSYSGLPDPTCPSGSGRSPKTGGICTGAATSSGTSTQVNPTPAASTWQHSITDAITSCLSDGVLVNQVRTSTDGKTNYPMCFKNGTTNAEKQFTLSNNSIQVFAPPGATTTLYSDISGSGTVVATFPLSSATPNQAPNLIFKSIQVNLPKGTTYTPSDDPYLLKLMKYAGYGETVQPPPLVSNNTSNISPTISTYNPDVLKILNNITGSSWPKYASEEHEKASEVQTANVTTAELQSIVKNEVMSQLGTGTANQTYYDCEEEEEEDECESSPSMKQGKTLPCLNDWWVNSKKSNVPCWGCN